MCVQSLKLISILCLTLAASPMALSQDKSAIYDVLQSAQETLDAVIKEATNGEFELPYELASQAQFNQAFLDFQNVLEGGDIEAMAKWFPSASELMTYVDATPGLEPYADWLRQRLDYAAVADEAVRTVALTQPSTTSKQIKKPAQDKPKVLKPKPQQKPLPKPTETKTKSNSRAAFVRDSQTWSKKLEGRQPVAGATKLVPRLKKIFSERGVPPELVWIAEVESTFNPAARSPAGAVGLFQLMPATAKHLGLEIEPEDQRLDPSKNGRAAAQYLKDLYTRFDDWPLAIAAYNGGEGRVSKLLKANNANDLESISDDLPGQTQMYVPKVLATIQHREGYDPTSRW